MNLTCMNPHLRDLGVELRRLNGYRKSPPLKLLSFPPIRPLRYSKAPLRNAIWTQELTTLRNQLRATTVGVWHQNPFSQESLHSNFSFTASLSL